MVLCSLAGCVFSLRPGTLCASVSNSAVVANVAHRLPCVFVAGLLVAVTQLTPHAVRRKYDLLPVAQPPSQRFIRIARDQEMVHEQRTSFARVCVSRRGDR